MQRRKMDRWRVGVSLLFALVLCLGMFGVAVADPPGGNPACEKEDPPPGCEDGHPGNGDGEDDDNGGDGGEGEANPLAPLGEVCSQVVQAIAGNDPSGQAIQLHALCEALGAEPLEGGGGGETPPGEEENPFQPLIDGCYQLADAAGEQGAQLAELCGQFESFPPDGGGGEGSPAQPLVDGCYQVVQALVDNGSAEFGQGEALCDAFAEQAGAEEQDITEPEEGGGGGESPLAPVKDGCGQVVGALSGLDEAFGQGQALCDALP